MTDGTESGTQLVKQHSPIDFSLFEAYYGENFWYYFQVNSNARFSWKKMISNDKMYFRQITESNGEEIWVSDGTTDGTKDIAEGLEDRGSWKFPGFVPFNGKTYFVVNAGNFELWSTDGTENGTNILKDIITGGSSSPSNVVALSDRLLFK